MPKTSHQRIAKFLVGALDAFVTARNLGTVLFAPLPVRLPDTFREPDVLFMPGEDATRIGEEYWDGANLVMEVVSDSSREKDLHIKRHEYAVAGIQEYWIVDPAEERIAVLRLAGQEYAVHGEFTPGQRAASFLLNGFAVDVTAVFASAKGK